MSEGTVSIIIAIITSGLISTILSRIFKVSDDKKEKNKAETDCIRWLMQDRLTYLSVKYISEAQADGTNTISPARHKVIREGYGFYKALPRANGDMEELMSNFGNLVVDYNRKELP